MESLQSLKRRLRGVQNIGKITKAMELVAATKMRKSQEIALASRPYAFAALELLATLSQMKDVSLPPLLQPREINHTKARSRGTAATAVVLVTSDKGLAGAFNSSVIRVFEKWSASNEQVEQSNKSNIEPIYIAVGQKAASYLEHRLSAGLSAENVLKAEALAKEGTSNLEQKFTRVGDYTTVEEVRPLADFLTKGFLGGSWDCVLVFSAHFKSALQQKVLMRQVLPIEFETLKTTLREIVPETGRFADYQASGVKYQVSTDYLIEPSPETVLQKLAEHLVLMEIYHLILEANASEHAARRLAMKNASDNASEIAGELTLAYNKSRQAGITKEIIEVTSGAESLR